MMKKRILLPIILFGIIMMSSLRVHAEEDVSDYLTYQEIIMSSGKLIKNYTESDKKELLDADQGPYFWGIYCIIDNQNVQATYIASVKECMENTGTTPITMDVSYSVETNTKVSFSASGSINTSGSGNLKSIKAEAAAKAGVEYTTSTTTSVKESRTLKMTVEPNSQYMVITTGNLSVTNGAVELYRVWIRTCYGFFEIVTLESQYAKLEKRSL